MLFGVDGVQEGKAGYRISIRRVKIPPCLKKVGQCRKKSNAKWDLIFVCLKCFKTTTFTSQ